MIYSAFAVSLVFFGEAFCIVAELFASKKLQTSGDFIHTFVPAFVLIMFGGALLVGGYMFGFHYLKNIWIVFAVSLGSVLIVEPLLALALFKQVPTTGSVVGIILGVAGIAVSFF